MTLFFAQAERHLMHHHGRTKKLAHAPNGYACGFPKPVGNTCTEHFPTKKLLQEHKKSDGHIRKVQFKKPTGRKKKK